MTTLLPSLFQQPCLSSRRQPSPVHPQVRRAPGAAARFPSICACLCIGVVLSACTGAESDANTASSSSSSGAVMACVPGAQQECPCLGGARGVQVCRDDGNAFGACMGCPGTGSSGSMFTGSGGASGSTSATSVTSSLSGSSSSSSSSSSGGTITGPGNRERPLWPVPPESPTDYTTTTDTVHDNVTGLTWQRAVPEMEMNFNAAVAYCDSLVLGDADDWTLPTLMELSTLLDTTTNAPTINRAAFPDTPGVPFWTSSQSVQTPSAVWAVSFRNATTTNGELRLSTNNNAVRCVRANGMGPAEPYRVNADEVHDNATGLTWQKTDTGVRYFEQATMQCTGLWRLPRLKELMSLVLVTRGNPALDVTAFPVPPNATNTGMTYWSATLPVASSVGWVVSFYEGEVDTIGPEYLVRSRCVR